MVSEQFTSFKGFLPIDARKVGQPHVINGENFMLNADGPYSAFGSDIISYERFPNSELAASFEIEGEFLIFEEGAIWSYDEFADFYIPEFIFPDAGEPSPWSEAFVGNVYYFAKKGVGLLQFNPNDGQWKNLDGVGTVPAGVQFITDASGRLIAVTQDNVYVSAFDDGEDFLTSPQTGAGVQSLGLVKNGTPLGAFHVANGGFIVLTDAGILIASFIDTTIPFAYKNLTEHIKPISAFAVVDIDDTIIMLDESGFWQTNGQIPEPFQPLMSEFFRDDLLPNLINRNPQAIRLTYNEDRQWLFVSVGQFNQPAIYTIAYVYYRPLDEWGIFNQRHHGFGTLNLTTGPLQGRNFGFVSTTNYLRRFTGEPRIEIDPDQDEAYHYHTEIDLDGRYENGVYKAATFLYMPERDETEFPDNSVSTLYDLVDTVVVGPHPITVGPVSSFIEVGLFRFTEQLAVDEMSQVLAVAIGQDEEPVLVFEEEDWLIDVGEEDWLVDEGQEDWGFDVASTVNYSAIIKGTVDGKEVWEDQEEVMERNPQTLEDSEGMELNKLQTQYFICYNNGIYHILRIEALQIGQSFRLKTVDIEGYVDGVLG